MSRPSPAFKEETDKDYVIPVQLPGDKKNLVIPSRHDDDIEDE
jgi:hypothetical protein